MNDDLISSPQGDYDTLRNVSAESPCPYLPDVQFRSETYQIDQLDGATYEYLLARGFRRSGRVVYRPRCRRCVECRQLRIRVADFVPTRSLARVTRSNVDLSVEIGTPRATRKKFDLFRAYLDFQHDKAMTRTFDAFVEFLYDSPIETYEICYLFGRRLIGVSLVDAMPGGLSSVYMYFDPAFRARSLGTFSILWEIEHCRRENLPYYYLGFYVAGAKTMAYKSRFRPHEMLAGEDHWVAVRA